MFKARAPLIDLTISVRYMVVHSLQYCLQMLKQQFLLQCYSREVSNKQVGALSRGQLAMRLMKKL